jgi:hypothetical protein
MRTLTAIRTALVALALVVAATSLAAKENYHEKAFNADTAEKFEATVGGVRKEMEAGGRYQYVKPDERKTIDKSLTEMQALFAQNGSVEAMNQGDKVKLFNAQEVVNSILTRRDGERVICKDEPKLGSHVRTTSCHTYAQEEEARRGSHDMMDEWTRRGCANSGCGPTPKKGPPGSGAQ